MRYLVTGGYGYVGSWVVKHLAEAGHEVFVLTRGPGKDLGAAHTAVRADVLECSAEDLAGVLPPDLHGCVHAASSNEAFLPGYAKDAVMVNAFGTRNLLEALDIRARRDNTPLAPLLYCSTFHVYGKSEGYVDESVAPAPKNDYALTHFFAEEYCRFFGRTRGLPHIILRLTNTYGAPRLSPFGKWYLLCNDICRMAFTEGKIVLNSDPSLQRDFVWLGDVVRVMEKLLERPDLAGRIFNISGGAAVSIGDVAALAAQAARRYTGKEVPVIFRREADTARPVPLRVDNSAVRTALGVEFADCMEQEMLSIFDFLARHGAA